MPSSIQIAAFIFGSVLLLLALVGGNIKIFGAEIPDKASNPIRFFSGVLGVIFVGIGLLAPFPIPPTPNAVISTNTPQSKPSPTTEEINNILVIEINGEQRTYAGSDFDFNSRMDYWFSVLQSDKYNRSDSLIIELPAQVQANEIIQIKPSTSILKPLQGFVYTGKDGKLYSANSSGSYIEIRIDTWEGRGGIATGSIEGKIKINQVDTITFTNGTFRIKIKPNGI